MATEQPGHPQQPVRAGGLVIDDKVPYHRLQIDANPIGSGAFGVVCKAVHKDWCCQVAYKELAVPYIADSDRHIKDLKNEAAIHRQLRNTNVVSMLGVVFEAGHYGLVLEYIVYGSLDKFLDHIKNLTGSPFHLSWRMKTKMSYDVCLGMTYLHSLLPEPVIHGDLKLQNLLLGEHLNVKISDFGLSRWKYYSRSHSVLLATIQGTLSHIPPEKLNNSDIRPTEKFDVYSYGILQWELFTEEKAFENCQGNLIRSLVIDKQRPPMNKLPDNVPPQITTHITSCWKQNPTKRPTFSWLSAELTPLIDGSKVELDQAVRDALRTYNRMPPDQLQSEHSRKLKQMIETLSDVIRRTDRILTRLLQGGAVTGREHDEIQVEATVYSLTRHLVDVLCGKPVTAYQCFLEALTATKQQHLYRLLEEEDYAAIDLGHRQALIDNRELLMSNIEVSGSLLNYLVQDGVMDEREEEDVKSKGTKHGQIGQLLHYIMRTTLEEYELFLRALVKSEKGFIVDKLLAHNRTRAENLVAEELRGEVAGTAAGEVWSAAAFLTHPTIHQVINGKTGVRGIAVSASEIFVGGDLSTQIDVYHIKTFSLTREIPIPDSATAAALVACSHNNCLYASTADAESIIHRFDLSNNSSSHWTLSGRCYGLSVTRDFNLIATLAIEKRIQEYTTQGNLIREIVVEINDPLRFDRPCHWHSVQLSSGEFVVCLSGSEGHKVNLVDSTGRVIKSYGGPQGSGDGQLNCPCQLSVDKSDNVIVADSDNNRVVLLSPTLTLIGYIPTPGEKLVGPRAVHLDAVTDYLFIGEWSSGRVLVLKASASRQ